MAEVDSTSAQKVSSEEHGELVYLWKIPIDRDYVKSIVSILRVVAAFLSLIAFICVASGRSENCDDDYASTYNYFEFISITTFLTLIIMWIFFAVTLHTRMVFKIVPWKFGYLIGTAVIIVLYLIANICLAAQSCGKDSNKAGAAFGFFVMFCLMGDAFLSFQEWRSKRTEHTTSSSSSKSNDYNAERNMEQY